MNKAITTIRKEIVNQINNLKSENLKEVLDFISFVKLKKINIPIIINYLTIKITFFNYR